MDTNKFTNCKEFQRIREIIGSLMYLTQATRPYLAYAVRVATRAQDNPTEANLKLAQRIMRYLKGTVEKGLQFVSMTSKKKIVTFSDADHTGDKKRKHSTSGIIIKLPNGPVIWKSKLQKCVSISSMEAEYVAASEVARSVVWLNRL